jgi:glycerol-3-phosphate dehydrogenase
VKHDISIVGGGLLGRLLAWRAALSGLSVELFDANAIRYVINAVNT